MREHMVMLHTVQLHMEMQHKGKTLVLVRQGSRLGTFQVCRGWTTCGFHRVQAQVQAPVQVQAPQRLWQLAPLLPL